MIAPILPSILIDGSEGFVRKSRAKNQEYKPLEMYSKNYDFTVIIPAYNASKTLERTLKSLEEYKDRTIVVDDGSTDETPIVAKKHGFEVIRSEKNRNKVVAIWTGLHNVDSSYTVLMDADSYPERPKLLPNLIQALYDESLIAAGVQVLPDRPSKAVEKFQYIEYKIAMEVGRRSMSKYGKNICISGAFGAFHTKDLKEITDIQYEDPHFDGEDLERTLYLLEKGRVGYFGDFVVRTIVPESLKDLTKQRIRWQKGYLRVHKKFLGMVKRRDEIGTTLLYNWIVNIGLHPFKLVSLPFLIYYDILSFLPLFTFYMLFTHNLFSSSATSEEKNLCRKYFLIYPFYSLYNLIVPTTIGYVNGLRGEKNGRKKKDKRYD